MKRLIKHTLVAVFALLFSSVYAQIQAPVEQPSAIEHSLFGWASAAYSNYAIVTAPQRDVDEKQSAGTAFFYIESENEWIIRQEILPEELGSLSNFGISTAMNHELAAIGSLGDAEYGLFAGAVYLYEYSDTSFTQIQKLNPLDVAVGSQFGYSLDFSPYESVLVVGAYQADGTNGGKTGAVYMFEPNEEEEWIQTQKLIAEDAQPHDFFGHQVEFLDENRIAIGAYNADGAEERSGAVYIFAKNEEGEWEQEAKLFDPNGASSDLFGYSLSGWDYSGDHLKTAANTYSGQLFIGAPGANNSDNEQSGAVYFYQQLENLAWDITYKLIEEQAGHNDHFGVSITHTGQLGLYVGASRSGLTNAGQVFYYEIDWDFNPEENLVEQIPFAGNDDRSPSEMYGSVLASDSNNDNRAILIFSSPYKTIDEKINAGEAEFYYQLLTSSEEPFEDITEYELYQNYPNPFNPSTTINYQVKDPGMVTLTVYN
ncbi:MAG: FG-GAP repeat protein, partial [Balneolales bacterium]|nr:FG-GAP repeat protein [Balneolales bacterium]